MAIVNTPEDRAIVRYLLGDLDDIETEKIEERYFCDSSFEEHIAVIEDWLVRCFLNRSLGARDLELFKSKYLRVPELREKVAFAQRLRTAARTGNKADSRPTTTSSWRHKLLTILPPAFAVVGLLCLVASWVVVRNARHPDNAPMIAPKASTQNPVSQQPIYGAQVLSVTLFPGLTKGVENRPIRLLLSSELTEVRLELIVPGLRQGLKARVEVWLVQSSTRKLAWSRDDISSTSTPLRPTILLPSWPNNSCFVCTKGSPFR